MREKQLEFVTVADKAFEKWWMAKGGRWYHRNMMTKEEVKEIFTDGYFLNETKPESETQS